MLLGYDREKNTKNIFHGTPWTSAYPKIGPFDLKGEILKLVPNKIPRIEVSLAKRIIKIS